jgi:hypothetical protein
MALLALKSSPPRAGFFISESQFQRNQTMARGGKRPGAGRPKGTVSPATQRRREIADQALAEGMSPLEIMLKAMRDALGADGQNYAAAFPFAKEAAPYMHAKLASTEVKMDAEVKQTVSAEPLRPDEWEEKYGSERPAH